MGCGDFTEISVIHLLGTVAQIHSGGTLYGGGAIKDCYVEDNCVGPGAEWNGNGLWWYIQYEWGERDIPLKI